METKKCPFCGEEILAEAKKCKHCGEWLDKKEKIPTLENDMIKEDTSSDISDIWIYLLGALFFAIGFGAYFFVSNKKEEGNKEYFQERKEQWERKSKQIDDKYFKPYYDGMKKLQEDF